MQSRCAGDREDVNMKNIIRRHLNTGTSHLCVCVCLVFPSLLLLLLLPVANFIVDFTTDRIYWICACGQASKQTKKVAMCKCVCVCVNEIRRWTCDRANKKGKTTWKNPREWSKLVSFFFIRHFFFSVCIGYSRFYRKPIESMLTAVSIFKHEISRKKWLYSPKTMALIR